MAEQSYFMGQDGFIWFVGVVEDREDPQRIGRVRVRCLGFHTEDLIELPTVDLPWAHVMHPVTDPSMQGLGSTPSFLVEGSWVIGFFRDAQEKQQPVIIGSLPGRPLEASDWMKGFNDPRHPESQQKLQGGTPNYGPYPVDNDKYKIPSGHGTGESDTNRLAQGEFSEEHESLINRRLQRLRGDPTAPDRTVGVDDNSIETGVKGTGIPIATQPYLETVSDAAVKEIRSFWDEPDPKSIKKYGETINEVDNVYKSSQYPYNHVHESESGHIHEIDDSPKAERLFTQHTSGTFEEIHPTGTRVVKVIGDNYEIVMGKSNIFISGAVNITTNGTVRELIKGDYHLEVEGDYTQKIHGNNRIKIGAGTGGGNLETEILGSYGYNIKQAVKGNVGEDVDVTIEGNDTKIINGTSRTKTVKCQTILADDLILYAETKLQLATGSGILSAKAFGGSIDIRALTGIKIETPATVDIDGDIEVDITSIASVDINGGEINLN